MENATTALATVDALHELTDELRRANAMEMTIAVNVTEVLHRSGLARLDLVEFLQGKGFSGPRLSRAIAGFAPAVKAAYIARYGRAPLPRLVDLPAGARIVNSYTELDRGLVEATFGEWSR